MNSTILRRHVVGACLIIMIGTRAAPNAIAQTNTPPSDRATRARLRFGPLWINPFLNVKNIGIDTNVFNDSEAPKQDFTATVSPQTEIFLRGAALHADLRVLADLVYYREYLSERSSNFEYSGLFSVPLTWFSPYIGASYASTRNRPGYEIDARARHTVTQYRAGADLTLGTRTTVGVDLSQADTVFDAGEAFRGLELAEQLNRSAKVARVTIRQALTPLTRVVVAGEVQSDRFTFNTRRDADIYRASAGVEFEPLALVSGRAMVGYRELRFRDDAVEGLRGVVSDVNVTYSIFPLTRLDVTASRDTQYSYDPVSPYYLQTGGTLVVTQRIFDSWDVQVTGGRQNLGYADQFGVRRGGVDRILKYGIGLGYRLGADARVGVTFMRTERSSPHPTRRYQGAQIGTSIIYGS